ncbi:MAG TPA: N,N-dimethylformamidase beta subunit family domain-containing protein [Candidatus Kapabacteria bacterium]|nr:N,N-dimethylformamidase beta subunit family domain-containing protein [Candidatus Kapabacteria bacterium]
MSNSILRTAITSVCLLLLFTVITPHLRAQEGGYTNELSVRKGDTLRFYISTSQPQFDLGIYRLGFEKVKITSIDHIPGGVQAVPDSAYRYGCHWKSTLSIAIPMSWASGVYEADFPTDSGTKQIVFIVKEQTLGSHSKTLVCLTVNTWQAYNNFGGKSVYNYNSTQNDYSPIVSFDRPFSNETANHYYLWANKLVKWMEREHFDAEFCTNIDLDRNPQMLDHYDVYCTVGHDEYWTHPERDQIQSFVDRGGRLIILGGNTCWWQARLEENEHIFVCYKNQINDPLKGIQDSLVSDLWTSSTVNDRENKLTGTSFENGGYVNNKGIYPVSKGYGGYSVQHSNSWIFDKTWLHTGDVFGQTSAVVGYETDGALYRWSSDSLLELIGTDETPSNFRILGLSPASTEGGGLIGAATMGWYAKKNGGAVFNAASINWANGLDAHDTDVEQITRNVFEKFRDKKYFPPEITNFTPRTMTRDSINHQWIYLPHRTVYCPKNMIGLFAVDAIDPQALPLTYTWKKNNFTSSHDSSVSLNFGPSGCKNAPEWVTVTVSNGFDSTTIGWWVVDATTAFITSAPSYPYFKHSRFYYKPYAVSTVDEHPRCTLTGAPAWLTMNDDGVITGTLDSGSGTFGFTVIASDKDNNFAFQSAKIIIKDSSASVQSEAADVISCNIFPNPFSNAATLDVVLAERAHVSVEITSLTGAHIRTLATNTVMHHGTHELYWDGKDDRGAIVGSGMYLVHIATVTHSGKESSLIYKLIKS